MDPDDFDFDLDDGSDNDEFDDGYDYDDVSDFDVNDADNYEDED